MTLTALDNLSLFFCKANCNSKYVTAYTGIHVEFFFKIMQMWTTIKKRQNTKNNKNMKTQKAERNTTDKWHGIPSSLACYSSPFHTGCSRLLSPSRVMGRFGGMIGQLAVQSVADPRPCRKVRPERCEKLMTCNGGEQQRRAELIKALKMTSSSKLMAASKVEQLLRVGASVTSIYITWK